MKFFIENSRLTLLVTLSFLVLGIMGIFSLKREHIPHVDFSMATISTAYPGSSSAEVEELITKKIEDEIKSVPGLKEVESNSSPGLSQILIRIEDDIDTKQVVNELSQKLQSVKGLPDEVLDPPRLSHEDSKRQQLVLSLFLFSDKDEGRKKDQYSFELKNRLENLDGIVQVGLSNYKEKEIHILLNTEKMNENHISAQDVINALKTKTMDMPAGYLDSGKTSHLTRLMGKFRTLKELENTIVRSNFSGNKVRVGDLALVKDSFEKEISKGYIYSEEQKGFDLKSSVSFSIFKNNSIDLISAANRIKKKIKEFKKTRLESGFGTLIGYDGSKETRERLSNVINNAFTGLFLIFIVFFLLLPSRLGLMASFSLPLALLGTFSVLPFIEGISFNVITMLAFVICIGMLVDNSVVVSEYFARLRLNEGKSPKEAAHIVTKKFFKPITATVLTTIVAFLPMLVTTGVMGQFIKWIPIVITLAFLMSLFEAFCLLPNRLQWLSFKKPSSFQEKIFKVMEQIENLFEKLLRVFIKGKYFTILCIFALFVSSIVLMKTKVKVNLFSTQLPSTYNANLTFKPNLSLDLVDQISKEVAYKMKDILNAEKNVEWMSLNINKEVSLIQVNIKRSVLRNLKYKEILKKLRQIKKHESLKHLSFNIEKRGPPVGKALKAAILSDKREDIMEFIKKVKPQISQIPGLLNLKESPDPDRGDEFRVKVQEELLSKLGIHVSLIGSALRTALEGTVISEVSQDNQSFLIRVKNEDSQMDSIENLKKIQIKEPLGRQIPLSELVKIEKLKKEADKRSYNFSPVVFLEADVDSKTTNSGLVNDQVDKILKKEIKSSPLIDYKLVGENESRDESLGSLQQAGMIAFFGIFIILVILFKSFLFSFLILSCIPLGLIGVIWAFFFHGRDLNFFAMIGIVGLAGVVVNSAIILISFILNLKEESNSSLNEIVIKASKTRFRPILITNLTTLGGLFPTAYGFPNLEPLLMPMTLALFWGLLVATILTLIWIPCLFLALKDFRVLKD